jgi:hypothetical protein
MECVCKREGESQVGSLYICLYARKFAVHNGKTLSPCELSTFIFSPEHVSHSCLFRSTKVEMKSGCKKGREKEIEHRIYNFCSVVLTDLLAHYELPYALHCLIE